MFSSWLKFAKCGQINSWRFLNAFTRYACLSYLRHLHKLQYTLILISCHVCFELKLVTEKIPKVAFNTKFVSDEKCKLFESSVISLRISWWKCLQSFKTLVLLLFSTTQITCSFLVFYILQLLVV